jgi:hypothetical protein
MRGPGVQLRFGVEIVAALALALCSYLALQSPREIASAYLSAYLFFLAPVMGSLVLLLLHALTGGKWGLTLGRPLTAALRVLPLLAVLLVPLLVCVVHIYPWARGDQSFSNWYLNVPFFLTRSIVCFAVWLWLAWALRARTASTATPSSGRRLTLFAALALPGYLFTVTTVATDWVMSLIPPWHSAVFGLTFGTSQILSAAALAAVAVRQKGASRGALQDVGRLLLMLILVWAYLVFMDFLTAWMADLPDETIWYIPRSLTSWRWLSAWIVLIGLVLPFCTLLSPTVKSSRRSLRIIGAILLCAQAGYCIWIVLPSLRPDGWAVTWRDVLPWIGVGGLCWARFDWLLERTPERAAVAG